MVTPDGPLDRLFQLRDSKTARISSADRSGGNVDCITIAPGETRTLAEIPGAGAIRRFYVAPLAADRLRYRKVVLRMYWDGEQTPSVEVPLGDLKIGVLERNHFALLGNANATARSGVRLRLEAAVRHAAAAVDGAALAVEQAQAHAVLIGYLGELLLSAEEGPVGGDVSTVLD